MEIRNTRIEELNKIKEIYSGAKTFMDLNGNAGQWENDYPQRNLLKFDIENKSSYVCVENGDILAVFSFSIGEEPTYHEIFEGQWLNNDKYGVIHRIAVAERNKGFASKCIQWCIKQFPNIKIDTHKNNIPMQKVILKNGFQYCGIIKKENGTERLAYQISSAV